MPLKFLCLLAFLRLFSLGGRWTTPIRRSPTCGRVDFSLPLLATSTIYIALTRPEFKKWIRMALSFISLTLFCALVFGVCGGKLSSLALASAIAVILATVLVACKG